MAVQYIRAIKLLIVLQIALQVVQSKQLEFKVNQHGIRNILIETDLKYNWFKAESECARKNMTLIALDSAEKSAVLDRILTKQFDICPFLWIGGQDLGKEGQFVWISNGKPFTFTNWKKGMPDNYGGQEDCVHVTNDRNWNDIGCHYHKCGFICEG